MTDRAVSSQVSFVLTIAITTIVVAGVTITVVGFIGEQRQSAAESELRVIGQRLGAQLMWVDRLATRGDVSRLAVEADVPGTVVGYTYLIEVSASGITLTAEQAGASATVSFVTTTPINSPPVSVSSGDVVIVYQPGPERITVRSGEVN
jgi:hypothetical protein